MTWWQRYYHPQHLLWDLTPALDAYIIGFCQNNCINRDTCCCCLSRGISLSRMSVSLFTFHHAISTPNRASSDAGWFSCGYQKSPDHNRSRTVVALTCAFQRYMYLRWMRCCATYSCMVWLWFGKGSSQQDPNLACFGIASARSLKSVSTLGCLAIAEGWVRGR